MRFRRVWSLGCAVAILMTQVACATGRRASLPASTPLATSSYADNSDGDPYTKAIGTLTVVDALVGGTINTTGRKSAQLTVKDTRWQRVQYWNGDSYIKLAPVESGRMDVVVPGWIDVDKLPVGVEVVMGLTSPTVRDDGKPHRQLRFVATSDGRVFELGTPSLARLDTLVSEAQRTLGVSSSRMSTLQELLEDAGACNDAANRGQAVPTNGLIARTARATSVEPSESSLAFEKQDRNTRQFPQQLSDIPDLGKILGKPVVTGEVAIFVPDGETPPTFLVVRFIGDGVLGPVHMNDTRGYGTLNGVFPTSGVVELAEVDPSDDPNKETHLGRWTLPAWPTQESDSRIMISRGHDGQWQLSIVPGTKVDAEVMSRIAK